MGAPTDSVWRFLLLRLYDFLILSACYIRGIGGDKIPEFWGKPSEYTEGTAFLGTPKNHLDLIQKRPLSPDVLEIDGKTAHYKFPWGALSSITNRATGCALTVGFAGAGYISLVSFIVLSVQTSLSLS